MRRIKNNKWNRIFHRNTIKSCREKANIYLVQCLEGQNFLEAIDKAESLGQLFNLHKDAWGSGFQCENLVLGEFLEPRVQKIWFLEKYIQEIYLV